MGDRRRPRVRAVPIEPRRPAILKRLRRPAIIRECSIGPFTRGPYAQTSKELKERSWEATLAVTWMASPTNDCRSAGKSPRCGTLPRTIHSFLEVLTFSM